MAAILLLNGLSPSLTLLPATAQAQNRAVIVTADQPNVWTLEQAHYLLAQMHRRNLDLRAKGLGELDANEINGLRIDVLKSLLEVGASFEDASRVTNSLLRRNQNFNTGRRESLLTRRDQLRSESLSLTREISRLQREKARETDPEEIERLNAEIEAKTAERDAVKEEIGFLDDELDGLNEPTGDFKTSVPEPPFDAERLPQGMLDEAFKTAAKGLIDDFNKSPQLNATLRLENYLQMQYEIIAKQLTLLRDEVGPGERLIFLEMPQSVNVTHDKANKKWAQSWWKVAGYTTRQKLENKTATQAGNSSATTATASAAASPSPTPAEERERNQKPVTTSELYGSILQQTEKSSGVTPTSNSAKWKVNFVDLDKFEPIAELDRFKNILKNREVRTVELIPRQSSINVNDVKLQTRAGALSAVASFLFGFGARVNFQRQREQFSQFVQQELYSSAFGKGSREFGWTFTPMPGTDRLISGVRTTYAVLVVPRQATSLVLETIGCYFPRSEYQPGSFDIAKSQRWSDPNINSRNCGDHRAFIVPIPNGGDDERSNFYVSGLTYKPVDKGKRIVVSIYGENFSSQIGVLVNGVALTPSLGLAQPFIRDDSTTGKAVLEDIKGEKIRGSFERIDADQIVATFVMPDDFINTPTITLVAPGKAVDLNRLTNLYINGVPDSALGPPDKGSVCKTAAEKNCVHVSKWMFGSQPQAPTLEISKVEVFRASGLSGALTALIHGRGFVNPSPASAPGPSPNPPASPSPSPKPPPAQTVFINGQQMRSRFVSSTLLMVENFPVPSEEKIQVALISGDDTINGPSVANPAFLRISNVTVVTYEAESDDLPGVLVAKLDGSGFSENTEAWIDGWPTDLVIQSPTEALLTVKNPAPAVVVTLRDKLTGISVKTIVTRKLTPRRRRY